MQNISFIIGDIGSVTNEVIVFIDEADKYAPALEMIQSLAGLSDKLKVIYTGSNLENMKVQNAATGRKCFFDLYPINFREFLKASAKDNELKYFDGVSLGDKNYSEMFHNELNRSFEVYVRLGGLPRILDGYIDPKTAVQPISQLMADLVTTIEDNVKSVLDDKAALHEYEGVLRKLAMLSMETLKFSKLQVQHVKRNEAKRLVGKTVGAQVEYVLKSPFFIALDVKTTRGDTKSLESCAVFEKDLEYLVKVNREQVSINHQFVARVPALDISRKIPLVTIPHYLSSRLPELLRGGGMSDI